MDIVYIAFLLLIIIIAIIAYVKGWDNPSDNRHQERFDKINTDYEEAINWIEKSSEMRERLEDVNNYTKEELDLYNKDFDNYTRRIKEQLKIHKEVDNFLKEPNTYKVGFDIKSRLCEVHPYTYMFAGMGFGYYDEHDYNRELKDKIERKAYYDVKEKLGYESHSKEITYFKDILDKWTFKDKEDS
jgi:hypothetical protein